jgi:4-amino-4-deoxy-L-arabinose transferase-like glycosyltransferase
VKRRPACWTRRFSASLSELELPLLITLLVVLVFRLLWSLQANEMTPDGEQYDRMAHLFLQSGTIAFNKVDVPSAFYSPGYPLFLAAVYAVFGADPSPLVAVHMAQALLSVVTLFVIFRIGVRLHGRTLGWIAVFLGALYPALTFANQQILTEVLFTCLLCLLVLVALRLIDAPSKKEALLFGVLLAACCYVRPTILFWGFVPFLFLLRRVPFRRLALLSVLGLAAFVLVMSPWWVRNTVVFDRFVPFNTSSANPLLTGTYTMFGQDLAPNEIYEPWTWSPEERLTKDDPKEELALNDEWRRQALERLEQQLKTEPGKVVWLRLVELGNAFGGPHMSWVLPEWLQPGVNVIHRLLLLFAAVGFALNLRDRKWASILALVVYYVGAHVVILMLTRYMFPLMPLVLVASGYGLMAVGGEIRRVWTERWPFRRWAAGRYA